MYITAIGYGLILLNINDQYGYVADITTGELTIPTLYQFFYLQLYSPVDGAYRIVTVSRLVEVVSEMRSNLW